MRLFRPTLPRRTFRSSSPVWKQGRHHDCSWADSGGQIGPDRPEGQTGFRCNARKNRRWSRIFRAIISNTCFTEQSWLDSTPPLSGLAAAPLECHLKGVVAGARTGFENSTGRSWGTGSARDVPEPVLGGMLRGFPFHIGNRPPLVDSETTYRRGVWVQRFVDSYPRADPRRDAPSATHRAIPLAAIRHSAGGSARMAR
jgi:hypothetical protein